LFVLKNLTDRKSSVDIYEDERLMGGLQIDLKQLSGMHQNLCQVHHVQLQSTFLITSVQLVT